MPPHKFVLHQSGPIWTSCEALELAVCHQRAWGENGTAKCIKVQHKYLKFIVFMHINPLNSSTNIQPAVSSTSAAGAHHIRATPGSTARLSVRSPALAEAQDFTENLPFHLSIRSNLLSYLSIEAIQLIELRSCRSVHLEVMLYFIEF